jgi:hypothetical protein
VRRPGNILRPLPVYILEWDFSLKHLHFIGSGRAESSMSYDPRNHLVTSSDITFGIGLCVTLLACLAIF